MRLLCSDKLEELHFIFRQETIEMYVSMCEIPLGEKYLSYNVYGLLHIVDDVRRLGPMELLSGFFL